VQDRSLDRQPLLQPRPEGTDDSTLPPTPEATPTKRRILLAGLKLFAERGYHATSIRDIAAGAGVQSASLYSHFASKEAILAELVLIGHDEHHRDLLSALLGSGVEPRQQLVALVGAHVRGHCRYPTLAVVANHEMAQLSEEALAPAAAIRRHSEAILLELLTRGEQQGAFRLVQLDATRVAIATMGSSVATWYPTYRDLFTPDQLADAYATLALRMVGADEAVS
jgi:AcrR family transcriptional regulator